MLNRTNLLIVVVAVIGASLGLLVGGWYSQAPPVQASLRLPPGTQVLQLGEQRVDLHLPDSDGKPRQLSEWNGKLLLVNFWATWCGPCREEMPLLQQTHARFADRGLIVLGIAVDDPDAVKQYLRGAAVHYPILQADAEADDPSILFGDTRGVLPYSVLIGRDGRLLAQHAGSFDEAGLMQWLQPHLAP